MHRAIAAFVRYLRDLPEDLQNEMARHEINRSYKLHPEFFRTQIIGDFPEKISIHDAFPAREGADKSVLHAYGQTGAVPI